MVSTTLLVASLLFATSVAAQDASLRAGSSFRGSLAEGDTASYTIEAGAHHFVMGEVDQVTVDVVVRVLDPEGRQLRRIDGPARGPE